MSTSEAILREPQRHGAHPHKQDLGGVLRLDVLVEGQQGRLAAAAARGAGGYAHEVAQVQVGHHHLGHRPIHPLQHLPPVLLRLLLRKQHCDFTTPSICCPSQAEVAIARCLMRQEMSSLAPAPWPALIKPFSSL